jgi:hypothetical protein
MSTIAGLSSELDTAVRNELRDGEDIARGPSCSLILRGIFNPVRMWK